MSALRQLLNVYVTTTFRVPFSDGSPRWRFFLPSSHNIRSGTCSLLPREPVGCEFLNCPVARNASHTQDRFSSLGVQCELFEYVRRVRLLENSTYHMSHSCNAVHLGALGDNADGDGMTGHRTCHIHDIGNALVSSLDFQCRLDGLQAPWSRLDRNLILFQTPKQRSVLPLAIAPPQLKSANFDCSDLGWRPCWTLLVRGSSH